MTRLEKITAQLQQLHDQKYKEIYHWGAWKNIEVISKALEILKNLQTK